MGLSAFGVTCPPPYFAHGLPPSPAATDDKTKVKERFEQVGNPDEGLSGRQQRERRANLKWKS